MTLTEIAAYLIESAPCERHNEVGCFDCMVGGAPSAHTGTRALDDTTKRTPIRPRFVAPEPTQTIGGYKWSESISARMQQPQQHVDPTAMTDKQRSYLTDLILTRGTDAHRSLDLDTITRWNASRLIDELRSAQRVIATTRVQTAPQPAQSPLPNVADGRYAIDIDGTVKFYRVNTGRDGRKWLDVQASDDLHPIHNYATKHAILTAIAADPRTALVRYGQLLGKCGICGRTLTDEQSRADGIGPICNGRTA